MKPKRIQLSRKKGWKMPPNCVKVDRTTRYGNPYRVRPLGHQALYYSCVDASEAVESFRHEAERVMNNDGELFITNRDRDLFIDRKRIEALRGKNLACWCKIGDPCHADVLIELANPEESLARQHANALEPGHTVSEVEIHAWVAGRNGLGDWKYIGTAIRLRGKP